MGKFELKLLIAAMLAVFGYIGYQQYRIGEEEKARKRAEREAGIRASEVLTEVFEKTAEFRVAVLSGQVRSRGECKSGNFIPNRQETIAPYSASYFVNFARVDRADFRWNGPANTMFVELPDPAPEKSSIDMSQARTEQSGVFVSRACGLAMQRQVAGRLSATADKTARKPENMRRARDAAREGLARLLRTPVVTATGRSVKVVVRFASEPSPTDNEHWDVSRSIAEVLANAS